MRIPALARSGGEIPLVSVLNLTRSFPSSVVDPITLPAKNDQRECDTIRMHKLALSCRPGMSAIRSLSGVKRRVREEAGLPQKARAGLKKEQAIRQRID